MKRTLAGLAVLGLVGAHDYALSQHRKRLDELEGRVDNFRRGLQTERRLIDAVNDDFDKLLVVTLPIAQQAKPWLTLMGERPGVVAARAELQAWLADMHEARARREGAGE